MNLRFDGGSLGGALGGSPGASPGTSPGTSLAATTLTALPFGVMVYDPTHCLIHANDAAWRLTRLEAGQITLGMPFPAVVRLLAYRGVYGAGDPEAQATQILKADRGKPFRRLLRGTDGMCLDLHSIPLAGGGFAAVVVEVTAHFTAAEEAALLARRLEAVLAQLHDGVAVFDADGRVALRNPAYEDLNGLPRNTVRPGMDQAEVLRALADRGEFANLDPDEVIAGRRAIDRSRPHTYRRERPNGQVLRLGSQPMPDGGYLVEVTDITDAQRAENEARRRAALLDGVLASMPHGVVVFGADQRVATVNAAYQSIMAGATIAIGEHRDEIARRRALAGEYGAGDAEALMRENLAEAADPEARRERQRPDGRMLDIRYAALPDGGRIQVTTDITPLHRARAEATARAGLLQLMLDNMRHGIALFDAERRLVTSNALAARLMGLPPERLRPGETFDALVQAQRDAGEFVLRTGPEIAAVRVTRDRTRPVRYTRARPDGTVVEVISDPTPDGGFVCTYSDITARARAEAEAREQAAMLQATIDNLRHGIVVYGPDRRVRIANRLSSELAGHAPGAIRPGRSLDELVQGLVEGGGMEPGPETEAMVARILGADRTASTLSHRRTPGGRVLEVHSDPMPDGGFIVTHIDITPLARAEAEARARAATLQVMLDNMRHGIALYGADRRVLVANALAAELGSLQPGDLQPGQSMDEVLRLQHARGAFDAAETERLIRLDRRLPHRLQRNLPDGRIVQIASDPTPDGGFVLTWSDITARARAEAEAEARAAVLKATLDGVRHAIAMYGPDHRLVTANRLARPDYGLPPLEQRVGHSFASLVEEQRAMGIFGSGAEAARVAAEAVALDRSRPIRFERRLPNGRIVAVASDPTPGGGFVITNSDVTELAEAKAAASERAAVLQVMLDNMRHGICYYGADRRVIAANALASELGGHPPGSLVPGRTLESLIAEQLALGAIGGNAAAVARAALQLDRSRPSRTVRPNRDGRIVEVTSDPTPDGGFVVAMADITPLAAAEAEAQRRAGILQAMLDNIRHGIALFDAEGRVVAANPVFHQLLELSEDLVAPGRLYVDFVAALRARGEYGAGEAGEQAAAAIIGRDRRQATRSIRTRPNGQVLEVVSDPTPDGGWVLTYTDVTDDRRIRAELEAARETAEGANRAKSRFLATMSHELRTPLNAVIGFSEAIGADPEPARVQDYAKSILEAGRHLLALIDDVLDVARAGTTGFAITESEVDIAALADASVRVMRATAATAKVSVEATLPAGLPLVRADPMRLRQVLLNLLSNAVKFTPADGAVRLEAGLEPGGDLVLRVADSGIGISAEDIPRAFEPFTQLDSALSRRFQGSGLGLYLSRALAEAQGATLTLDSTPGVGTTAVLRIPPARLIATDATRPVPPAATRQLSAETP